MRTVSVVVRFRNEAEYLDAVLSAVRAQQISSPIEIIAVDNASTDSSRSIAERHADKILDIHEYHPGAALNQSIAACSGEHVAVLSAHALPADERWLANLTRWLRDPSALGVYGAQMYPSDAMFLDKRDLDIFADHRPRTERGDSDFWNANSAFHRVSWEKQPFDETAIELEDHYWTKLQLPAEGRWVRFEPAALVYHYGHQARIDREYLAPTALTDTERIDRDIAVLDAQAQSWPAVMRAGLTLGSLNRAPGIERAIPAIGRHLRHHPDFDVRWRMAAALGRISSPASVHHLLAGLQDPSFYPRDESAWALGRQRGLAVMPILESIGAMAVPVQPFAALALGLTGDPVGQMQAVRILGECLASSDRTVVRDALYFLGEIASATSTLALTRTVTKHLVAEDYETCLAAAWTWGKLHQANPGFEALEAATLVELAGFHPLDPVRVEAVIALGRTGRVLGDSMMTAEVVRRLNRDGSGRVRCAAMQSLRLAAEAGNGAVLRTARAHEEDPDFGVRFERQLLLRSLSQRKKEPDA